MAKTTSITIGPQLDEHAGALVASGPYRSTSVGLRGQSLRLSERQTAALRAAVAAGEQSGETTHSLYDIAARVRRQHHV